MGAFFNPAYLGPEGLIAEDVMGGAYGTVTFETNRFQFAGTALGDVSDRGVDLGGEVSLRFMFNR